MKATILGLTAALVALPAVSSAQDSAPPLPVLDVSTMLILMLTTGNERANSLDPIDVNAFDIHFDIGNDDTQALDDLLEGE
jgi:hypothetical protein